MKALLQSSRRWLALAGFVLCVGVILAAPNFVAGQDPKKTGGGADIEETIKKLPASTPKEQIERIRKLLEESRKRAEEAQQRAADMAQPRGKLPRFPGRSGATEPNRLGVRLRAPDDTLIAQLGLADGNGMLLAEVPEGSVAAKAGFMANDILLKLDGKDVSSTLIEFTTALNAIKTDTPVDAVVLRMGKEETIQGLKLPDVPANPRPNPFQRRIQLNLRPAAPRQ